MNARNLIRALSLAACLTGLPMASYAHFSVGVTVAFAPPVLPVYVQPPCPAPGYIWTPGYWAYVDDGGYYWVPGTWVLAPAPGLLWTPGYWAMADDYYVWHGGYWAPHVGFYGGINYGFGYFGIGFAGGYWHDRDFYYNRAVTNVTNVNITNVYNRTIVNNNLTANRVSYNGAGGVQARPVGAELAAAHERHYELTPLQRHHAEDARTVPLLLASVNHGQPVVAATARPGVFEGRGVVPARQAGISPLASTPVATDPRAPTARPPAAADRPSWASRSRPEPARGNAQSLAQPVRAVPDARSAPAYRYNPVAAPGPAPRSPAERWTPPSYRAQAGYRSAPTQPPMRQYTTQLPPQHYAQPRPQWSGPVSHGNTGGARSVPSAPASPGRPPRDARRA
jgi:hypothetical protein